MKDMVRKVINIDKDVKPDLFGEFEQLNKKYEDKFLNEIHPLIKRYHDITGNDFKYAVTNEIIIDWNGSHYWVYEGALFSGPRGNSGIWWDINRIDSLGRPFGGEKNGDFYLIARLCCKYEKEIRSKIEFDLKEMMK